ncbi:MAG: transcription-repair coupling factor [Gemmatimonadales bacterium]
MLPSLVKAFRDLPILRALAEDLPLRGTITTLGGLPGASPAVMIAALAEQDPQRFFLIVAHTPAVAERWCSDLDVLMADSIRLYPQREALGEEEPHLEIAGERAETVQAIVQSEARVVVTTLRALAEVSRMSDAVVAYRIELAKHTASDLSDIVVTLEQMGYERVPSVRDVGEFAVRGGLIDLYGFGMAAPTRIEWWGDEIVSLRGFDLDSQRSEAEIERVTVLPVKVIEPADDEEEDGDRGRLVRKSLFDLIPSDALLVVDQDVNVADVGRIWDEAKHHIDLARKRGEDVPNREAIYLTPEGVSDRWHQVARMELMGTGADFDFRLGTPPRIERKIGRLARMAASGSTLILCDNEGQLERLDELLMEDGGGVRSMATLALGALSGGFVLPNLTVLSDHEIFARARRLRRNRRYRQATRSLTTGALSSGDYVVHLEHGIGVYRGVETITVGEGTTIEVAVVEYEGGDRLNVPLYGLDQLEPYRMMGDETAPPPRLHRLGGSRWRTQRAKAERAIQLLATELIDLYARRSVTDGFAFPPDGRWQRELESAFLYEDTPDQRRATEETKADMERPRPMDRLIVGDVGYGKTEVAIRAAFKAVLAGKQVAVLVPTTILAEQHGRTFQERLADYPVNVEVLSRFRTAAEQREVIKRLQSGQVDIIIGTHRLLSKDVTFKDLGMLVVDEEHRFGVRHKERLKALRLEVDVLTLTATPIPRTLHLAMSGLRDLTLMETAPRDRSPVLTFIEPWDDALLEEVMAREVDRGGQVYFVHNRIETIEAIVERVRRLVPRAVVETAHGKLKERELDGVMRRFVAGEVDVLVSTMIVESGLDVPNANTMIVHKAHHLGLAQLYQLRGRVGRGHRRAFCYLLVPDIIDRESEERLKILEHHTELGSGYRIALRDLELRGAGNLLGADQSGHAHAVGVDLYLRWLEETVRALRGSETAQERPKTEVLYDGAAFLPDEYVSDDSAKFDLYRRFARVTQAAEIAAIREELRDRFGPVPPEAEGLLAVTELRILGARIGLETILVRGEQARIRFHRNATPRMMRLTSALDDVQFAADVRQTRPLTIKLRRLGGLSIDQGLVRALAAVAEGDNGGK